MNAPISAVVGFAILVGLAGPALGQPGGGKKDDGAAKQPAPTLKETYKKHFLIGMAGDLPGNYSAAELNLAKGHFDVLTPENCMKPGPVHPAEDKWSFERPDALMKWCAENKIAVFGHTLVWHSQT